MFWLGYCCFPFPDSKIEKWGIREESVVCSNFFISWNWKQMPKNRVHLGAQWQRISAFCRTWWNVLDSWKLCLVNESTWNKFYCQKIGVPQNLPLLKKTLGLHFMTPASKELVFFFLIIEFGPFILLLLFVFKLNSEHNIVLSWLPCYVWKNLTFLFTCTLQIFWI